MRVGEVMALMLKHCSREGDDLLMLHDIYMIDIDDEGVTLRFTDGNTPIRKLLKDGSVDWFDEE